MRVGLRDAAVQGWSRRPRIGLRPAKARGPVPPPGLRIAHRGGRAHAPDNSLEAIATAAELGADGVELDVRLSSSGLVCAHDRGQPGPQLRDALELVDRLGLWLEVDLKSDGRDGAVPLLVDLLRDRHRTWVSSFHPFAAWQLRQADPGLAVGWALLPNRRARPLLWTPWIRWLGVQIVEPHVSLLSSPRLATWTAMGLRVVSWGVLPEEERHWRQQGVGVVVDRLSGGPRCSPK